MGRVIPQHSYDHTRRSQRDIVVYNDIELRNVLGNVKRGSRVVIASKINVTRTVEIKMVDDNSNIDSSQGIIISGFGTGRLTPKDGTVTPFDMFRIRVAGENKTLSKSPISIQYLNFSGFSRVVNVVPEGSSRTLRNFSMIGCVIEECDTMLGTSHTPLIYADTTRLAQAEITNNVLNPHPTISTQQCALSLDIVYEDTTIDGNIDRDPSISFLYTNKAMTGGMQETSFSNNVINGEVDVVFDQSGLSSNTFKEKVILDGSPGGVTTISQSVINDNRFIRILYDSLELKDLSYTSITGNVIKGLVNGVSCHMLTIVGNYVSDIGFSNLLANTENYILRENFAFTNYSLENQYKPLFGAGRISTGGEVLAQQVIDSTTSYFSCLIIADANTDSWQQLNNDAATGEKPTVEFYVPEGTRNPTLPSEGKTVIIRLKIWAKNAGPSNETITIRITDQDSPTLNTLPASVHKPQGFRMPENVGNGSWEPMVFEWIIEPGLYWDVGQQAQIWFQANTDQNALGPACTMVGGHFQDYIAGVQPAVDFGPIITSAIAVPQNLVTVSASTALKKGRPLPPSKILFKEKK